MTANAHSTNCSFLSEHQKPSLLHPTNLYLWYCGETPLKMVFDN